MSNANASHFWFSDNFYFSSHLLKIKLKKATFYTSLFLFMCINATQSSPHIGWEIFQNSQQEKNSWFVIIYDLENNTKHVRRADDELGNELNEEQSTGGTGHREKNRFPLFFSTAATDAKPLREGILTSPQYWRKGHACWRVNTQEINHTFVLLKITCLYRCKVPAKWLQNKRGVSDSMTNSGNSAKINRKINHFVTAHYTWLQLFRIEGKLL